AGPVDRRQRDRPPRGAGSAIVAENRAGDYDRQGQPTAGGRRRLRLRHRCAVVPGGLLKLVGASAQQTPNSEFVNSTVATVLESIDTRFLLGPCIAAFCARVRR